MRLQRAADSVRIADMASASPTGYSNKPIWAKLGLDAKRRLLVRNAPGDYAALVGATDLAFATPRGAFDIAHVFVKSAAALSEELVALERRLPDHGAIWISWPKKASRIATDVSEDIVREIALPLGLVDVKVCAIDAVWSGLKLVRRREARTARS